MGWRCFFVMVHGQFQYHVSPSPSGLALDGFYAGRWLLAHDKGDAIAKAFARVQNGLERWNQDIAEGWVTIQFEADDVGVGGWWNLFRRSNRGHVFYGPE